MHQLKIRRIKADAFSIIYGNSISRFRILKQETQIRRTNTLDIFFFLRDEKHRRKSARRHSRDIRNLRATQKPSSLLSTCNRFLVPFHRFRPAHELTRALAHVLQTDTRAREMRSVCVLLLLLSFPLTCARGIFANLASKHGECCRISCSCFSLVLVLCMYFIIQTYYIIWNQVTFITN